MVELARLNSVLDRLEHGWADQLEQCCWQAWTWLCWPAWTVLLTGLFMHVGTDCSWLNEWTDLNNVVGTIMINQQRCFVHVCSNITIPVDSPSCTVCITICWNMIEQYCYFTNPVSIMLKMLLQGCWVNNLVYMYILWYFYACTEKQYCLFSTS